MRLRVSLLPLYLAAAAISLIRAIIFFDESTISSLVGIVLVHDGRSVTASSRLEPVQLVLGEHRVDRVLRPQRRQQPRQPARKRRGGLLDVAKRVADKRAVAARVRPQQRVGALQRLDQRFDGLRLGLEPSSSLSTAM